MILLQRIVSSHLTCGHKNTGRLILKGEKVQNMLTPRLISENLIRPKFVLMFIAMGNLQSRRLTNKSRGNPIAFHSK